MPEHEARTVDKCAELREACRAHMDANHELVMGKLGDIEKSLAYEKGQANGIVKAGSTGTQAPILSRFQLPSIGTVIKCGLLVGALVASGIIGGCEGVKLAVQHAADLKPVPPSAAKTGGAP